MYLSHPLGVTFCQIIIDRNDMYALSFQCIQIRRKSRYQRLTFTGTHLCDTSLVQYHTTDQLHAVMAHADCSLGRFTHYRISLWQNII